MDERLTELTVRRLVRRLASSDPVPGGGSASTRSRRDKAPPWSTWWLSSSVDRPAAAGHEETLAEIRTAADARQAELLNLAELDANAYAAVVHARRLPKVAELEREARAVQLAAAIREATRVPLATAQAASEVLELAGRLAPIGNRNAISDVGVAALLAVTSVRGAALNVQINLPSVTADEELRDEAASGIERLLAGLDERERTVRNAVAERLR